MNSNLTGQRDAFTATADHKERAHDADEDGDFLDELGLTDDHLVSLRSDAPPL
jgi:hypothetical protein